jgi:LPXTG-motif cell wall-anchored protein
MEPQPPPDDIAPASAGDAFPANVPSADVPPADAIVTDARPAPMPWEQSLGAAPSITPEPQVVGGEAVVSWAPPEDHARDVPGAPGLVYAGTLPRTLAWIVDLFIIGVLSLVILGVLITLIIGSPETGDTTLSIVTWVGIAVIAAVYFIVFWTGGKRATPGMRALRLQIGIVETGATLTPDQAAIRVAALGIVLWPIIAVPTIGVVGGLALFVWPIVLLVSTALNERRRGIHDRISGSAIVQPGGAKSQS